MSTINLKISERNYVLNSVWHYNDIKYFVKEITYFQIHLGMKSWRPAVLVQTLGKIVNSFSGVHLLVFREMAALASGVTYTGAILALFGWAGVMHCWQRLKRIPEKQYCSYI